MRELVEQVPQFLKDAIRIGENCHLSPFDKKINNVIVVGLGGSGIGGTILSQLLKAECPVPILTNKDYDLPNWVDENTLVIGSSYSGNTEETIAALEKAAKTGSEIVCVTSGGKLKSMAEENSWNHILIPSGNPPRSMLAYSLTQLLFIAKHYGLCGKQRLVELKSAQALLEAQEKAIISDSLEVAKAVNDKRIIFYSDSAYEGIAVRYRQQVNENSKQLCWHHALPEMNHNELVGWAGGDEGLAVFMLRNTDDHPRTQTRMELCKGVFKKYTNTTVEVYSAGDNLIERSFYHILFGDWLSIHLAEMNNIDPVEIEVINFLKGELAKIK